MKSPKRPRGIRKPKGYKPGDISRNLYLSSYAHVPGNDPVSGEAAHFLIGCKNAASLVGMTLKCGDGNYELDFAGYNLEMMAAFNLKMTDVDKFVPTLGQDICGRILWAIQNKDGYFFKDLARLCEAHKPKFDSRFWLTVMHWDIDKGTEKGRPQDRYFTAKELCEKAEKHGARLDERQVHEVCKELGITLARRKGWKKQTSGKIKKVG